ARNPNPSSRRRRRMMYCREVPRRVIGLQMIRDECRCADLLPPTSAVTQRVGYGRTLSTLSSSSSGFASGFAARRDLGLHDHPRTSPPCKEFNHLTDAENLT